MDIKRRIICYYCIFSNTTFLLFLDFQYNFNLIYFFIMLSSLLSILTVYCTSKIYASLKTVPAWHNPLVPTIYILNSIVSGSLVIFLIFYYYDIHNPILTNLIVIILPTTLFIKLLYWYSIRLKKTRDIRSAFELKKNNKKNSFFLRTCCIVLTYISPTYCLLQTPTLVVSNDIMVSIYIIFHTEAPTDS